MIIDGQYYPEYADSAEDIELMKSLTQDQLDLTPFDTLKWQCCVQGCTHHSKIRDYGIAPWYHWGRRGWINLRETVLYCGKHNKIQKLYPQKNFVYKLGAGIMHLIPHENANQPHQ